MCLQVVDLCVVNLTVFREIERRVSAKLMFIHFKSKILTPKTRPDRHKGPKGSTALEHHFPYIVDQFTSSHSVSAKERW